MYNDERRGERASKKILCIKIDKRKRLERQTGEIAIREAEKFLISISCCCCLRFNLMAFFELYGVDACRLVKVEHTPANNNKNEANKNRGYKIFWNGEKVSRAINARGMTGFFR